MWRVKKNWRCRIFRSNTVNNVGGEGRERVGVGGRRREGKRRRKIELERKVMKDVEHGIGWREGSEHI